MGDFDANDKKIQEAFHVPPLHEYTPKDTTKINWRLQNIHTIQSSMQKN